MPKNLASARVRGHEVAVRGRFWRRLGVVANYTHQDARETSKAIVNSFGKRVPGLPADEAYARFELWFLEARRANPGRRLRKPALTQRRFARVPLEAIQVEPRKGPRRKRRFCAARKRWRSLAHVRGGKRILKLS
jgi:hypothetical protein